MDYARRNISIGVGYIYVIAHMIRLVILLIFRVQHGHLVGVLMCSRVLHVIL